MSDDKTNSKQMDGLDKGADSTEKAGGPSTENTKTKSRNSKEKSKAASNKRDSNKKKPASETEDGYRSARRVWPD